MDERDGDTNHQPNARHTSAGIPGRTDVVFVMGSARAMIVCALLAITAAAGCRTMSPQSRPTATPSGPAGRPTGSADASGGSAAATGGERPQHTEADVRFMQGMIAHHAQALVMTALVPERAGSDDIRALAERIEVSQRDEIALMQRWLRDRGEAVPSPEAGMHEHAVDHPDMPGMSGEGGHEHLMPGMLTEEELARLARAKGTEFDRLFLEFMIQHHEGALTMVAQLLATPGAGQEPAIFRFASDVNADQRMEIRRMRAMLGATPAREPRH